MEERPKSRLSAGAACFPGEHPSTPRAAPPVPDEDHSDGTSTPPTSSVSSREHPILQKKENTIFVGGLPPAADVEDLRQYFRVFGPLTVVRLIRDVQTGRSKRYAFVSFHNEADAAAALSMQVLNFHGKFIDIGLPRAGMKLSEDAAPQSPRREGMHASILPSSFRVFVCNLPRNATEAVMVAFFSVFGPVVEFKLCYDGVTGLSKAFGFAGFAHKETADVLKSMKSVEFAGRTLSISEVRQSDTGSRDAAGLAAGWGETMPPAFASMLALQASHQQHYAAHAAAMQEGWARWGQEGMGAVPYSAPAWQPPLAGSVPAEAAAGESQELPRVDSELPLPIAIPLPPPSINA